MRLAQLEREYPRALKAKSGSIEIQRLGPETEDALYDFAQSLDQSDLVFLRMDLTKRSTIEELVASQKGDRRITLLAEMGGEVVGYASLSRDQLSWMRHLGEIRVIVSPAGRGQGLGSLLAREVFQVAGELGLTKIVARMAREQEAAQELFRNLGFTAEALLADWVIDGKGKTHDLVIMSHDVTSLTN